MANSNSKAAAMAERRSKACLEAVWEIDALARILPGQVPPSQHGEHLVIRGIAGRILALASVLMSGIDEPEDMVPTEQLERKLLLNPENY